MGKINLRMGGKQGGRWDREQGGKLLCNYLLLVQVAQLLPKISMILILLATQNLVRMRKQSENWAETHLLDPI